MNKAGMCWHITSGQGHSCQDWVAPQEHFIRSCPNSRNVFWDRSGFYFSLLSRKQGPACASGPERTSLIKTEANIPYKFYLEEDEALKCKEMGEAKTIVFGLTGTGYFDMVAYEKFHDGKMTDYIPTDADLQKGFDGIPHFPGNE